jgi:hypothetical protein
MRARESKRGPETKRVHESKDTPRPVTVTAGVRGEAPPYACCTSCQPANEGNYFFFFFFFQIFQSHRTQTTPHRTFVCVFPI